MLRVTTSSGAVRLIAEVRPDVVVERGPEAATERDGARSVQGGSSDVVVRCPTVTDVVVGTSSGAIELIGRFGEVRATTSSAAIAIEAATGADLRTSSGRISVGACDGRCRVSTSSGRIEVGAAAAVEVRTSSGRVDVTAESARVRAVSGRVSIRAGAGDVQVETVSGRVMVTVPPGRRPAIDTGATRAPRIDVEPGHDGTVRATMVSGRLTIASA